MVLKELEKVKDLIEQAIDSIEDEKVRKLLELNSITDGKKIRPYIYLLCKKNFSKKIDKKDIRIAAGIELIHFASIIHDDVVDETTLRRGNLPLNKKQGNHQAVIVGDIIFSLALDLLSDLEPFKLKKVFKTLKNLSIGQAVSYENRYNYDLTKEEYFSITKLKTVSLFVFCLDLASDNDKDLQAFGECFGEYFQLKDDLNDILEKNLFEDLKSGEITLPLIILIKKVGKEKLDHLLKNQKFKEICELIIDERIDSEFKELAKIKKNKCIEKARCIKNKDLREKLIDLIKKI